MNEKQITFWIDRRKFTIKLVPDIKPQNKVHYYIMSESKDIINFTLTEDDITEALEGDNESHPIIIESEEESDTSSDENTKLIPSKLKSQYLEHLTNYLK